VHNEPVAERRRAVALILLYLDNRRIAFVIVAEVSFRPPPISLLNVSPEVRVGSFGDGVLRAPLLEIRMESGGRARRRWRIGLRRLRV